MTRIHGAVAILIAAACVGGVVSPLLFPQKPLLAQEARFPSITSAEEFRLVDAKGRTRALLALSAEGEPYLALLDKNETRKLWLGLSEESGLAIRDRDGKTQVVLSLDANGEPALVFRDQRQNTRAISAVKPVSEP